MERIVVQKNLKIINMPISAKAINVLSRLGLETVEDLLNFDWVKFARIRNCGAVTIAILADFVVRLYKRDLQCEAEELEKTYAKFSNSLDIQLAAERKKIKQIRDIVSPKYRMRRKGQEGNHGNEN